jgi:chaperone BCS1
VDTSFVESDSGKISTRYEFQPSVGTHFMQYRGTWIRVERTREQRMLEPWETVQLTTFGRHRELFVDILEESRMLGNQDNFELFIKKEPISTFFCSRYKNWV